MLIEYKIHTFDIFIFTIFNIFSKIFFKNSISDLFFYICFLIKINNIFGLFIIDKLQYYILSNILLYFISHIFHIKACDKRNK